MTRSPLAKFVDSLSEQDGIEYMTTAQVAVAVGRSTNTIKRWVRDGYVEGASREVVSGSMRVGLYTPEDVERIKDFAATMTPGRRTDLEVDT